MIILNTENPSLGLAQDLQRHHLGEERSSWTDVRRWKDVFHGQWVASTIAQTNMFYRQSGQSAVWPFI